MKWLLCLILLPSNAAELHADVALLLEQPHSAFGAFNPTGHTAVYLSRVCAQSPTELRRCRDGESGVVISRYGHIAGFDWLAIPLMPYFYAVEKSDQIPETVNGTTVSRLRNDYRIQHLQELIPGAETGAAPQGDWTQLVGAAYDRKTYVFLLETAEAADDALIARLNSRPNQKRFNILYRNCADFAKDIINYYYPKAVRRSILADVGITTPKQIAKSLLQYRSRRPELRFGAFAIPQVDGKIKRSKPVRGVLESLIRSKKYVLPLVVFSPWIAVGGSAAYITGGRFNPENHVLEDFGPGTLADRLAELQMQPQPAELERDYAADSASPSSFPKSADAPILLDAEGRDTLHGSPIRSDN